LDRRSQRADPDKRHLADGVKTILHAARQNSATFDSALRVALAAMREGNEPLLKQAVARMLRLEREALKLAKQLNELLERLHAARAEAGTGGRH